MKFFSRRTGIILMITGLGSVVAGFISGYTSSMGSVLVLGGFFVSYMGSYLHRSNR